MSKLRTVCEPKQGPLKIVGLISGSGTRLVDILEHQAELEAKKGSPYQVVGVFSENPDSKAKEIGDRFNLPSIVRDLRRFCQERGKKITDLNMREEFDRETVQSLEALEAEAVVYAGYVWVATAPLVKAFIGINGHPADLSVISDGKRAYAGADGIGAALTAGETELFATTHLVTTEVDAGPILIVSKPVTVEEDTGMHTRDRWRKYLTLVNRRLSQIFPVTVELLASGQFERDDSWTIHYKNQPIPNGLRM
jgi:folate-dependent phosphoribosylglycinamide formyltransferase PurN